MADFTAKRRDSVSRDGNRRNSTSRNEERRGSADYKFANQEEPLYHNCTLPKTSRLFAPTTSSKSRKQSTHERRQSFEDIMKPLRRQRSQKSSKNLQVSRSQTKITSELQSKQTQHRRRQSHLVEDRTGTTLTKLERAKPSSRQSSPDRKKSKANQKNEIEMDTWDSVKEQITCTVCNMVFKTKWKFDRHLQFSVLHQRNLERAKNPYGMIAEEIEVEQKKYETRLIYSGSKYFWRIGKTMDITIHQYDATKKKSFIHIIPYDVEVEKESKHFYLDYDRILDVIDQKELMKQSKEYYNNLPLNKKHSVGEEHTYNEKLRQTIVTFCMARLQVDDEVDIDPDEPNEAVQLKFAKLAGDDYDSLFLKCIPLVKEPKVLRRRRSSLDEFNASFSKLIYENQELESCVNKADHYAGMAEKALDYLSTIKTKAPAS